MSNLVGNYAHVKNENLEPYYQAIGIPYVGRKMMSLSSPSLAITNDGENWTISTSTMIRTVAFKFKLGEEYDEDMPKGALKVKSITTMEDENTLKTVSIGPNETKIVRTYVRTDDGCVLTLRHEASGTEGKRYFKRT